MKETAIEFLMDELHELEFQYHTTNMNHEQYQEAKHILFKKAKQMYEEQIRDAFYNGGIHFQEAKETKGQEVPYMDDAIAFFNQTYKQQK